jgi:nitroreductase
MEYAELLAGRRSTRHFDKGREVPDELLERVLAAPLTMPHAGNTYDWRGVVLRRRDRDPDRWPLVFSALLEQSYVEEADVLVVYAVQPAWWAEQYRANVATLVERGLLDPARHQVLLDMVGAGIGDPKGLAIGLVGEAMMGVAAGMLAAIDAGLGATVTGCRPGELAKALELPEGVVLCPYGVLALGWPAVAGNGASSVGAPKPPVGDMYFSEQWGGPPPTAASR